MKRINFLISNVVLFLLLSSPLANAAGTISIDDNLGILDITASLDYLEDQKHAFTIDSVIQKDTGWTPVGDGSVSLGHSMSRYWFRFTMINYIPDDVPFMLELDNPLLDSISLYVPDESGIFSIKQSGDSRPFFTREVDDKNIIFRLQQETGKVTYYLSVSSLDGINFRTSVMSKETYLSKIKADYFLNLIFLGVMIILIIYNLAVYISIRKANYIYLVLFIIFSILSETAQSGYGFQYIWTSSVWLQGRLPIALEVASLLPLTLFIVSFDVIREKYPIIFKFHIATIIIPVFIFLIVSFALKREFIYLAEIIIVFYVVSYFLAVEIFSAFARRSRPAMMMLGGYSFLSIAVIINMLARLGLLPVNELIISCMKLGTIIFVFMLTFALTHRIITRRQILLNKIDRLESKVRERIIGLYESDGLWGPGDH